MAEHLTQKQVEEYCRQRLRVAELLPVSDHLGECEACRQRVESAMQSDAAFFGLRAEVFSEAPEAAAPQLARTHLTAEQMAEYVDTNLTGEALAMAADHLTHCEVCVLAVNDLRAFRDQVAPSLEHEYSPATAPPPKESWWQRTTAALSAFFFRRSPGLAFGAALAILLLAVTGWLLWPTSQVSGPEQAVDVTPAPPAPSSPAPPSQAPPVSAIAQLNDGGGQLTLDQQGKLSGADDLPIAYQNMLKAALTTRRIERSSLLKGLSRPPSALMSTYKQAGEFSVLEPVGSVLLSDHPTFRWSPMAGATAYVVEVYDDKFNLMVASPELTAHSWTPPQALSRGKLYAWQVKASKDGQEFKSPQPPAPQARFRILDQAKANELANAKRAYAASHLTLALLYAEAGLLKEAEQELRVLLKANPDSELTRRLLSQVQALRRRTD